MPGSETKRIAGLLQSGGVVIIPTDTLFGLAGCLQPEVMQRIYSLKGRDFNKPLAILVNGIAQLQELLTPTDAQLEYTRRLLPGAVTCIFPGNERLAELHPAYTDGIAIRWLPPSPVDELLQELDEPLLLTSANPSGETDPGCLAEINEKIREEVDAIYCPELTVGGNPSALVDLRGETPIVSRSPLTLEQLLHD